MRIKYCAHDDVWLSDECGGSLCALDNAHHDWALTSTLMETEGWRTSRSASRPSARTN